MRVGVILSSQISKTYPFGELKGIALFILCVLYKLLRSSAQEVPSVPIPERHSPKLLILLVDGFRWDYFERQKHQLPGFRQLISNGIQVEYVEPIFPSLSFPSWNTLVTGVYPENHNILGNYMLFLGDDEFPESVFHLKDNSTQLAWWWQSAEPLWITATKAGHKSYLANFCRCDVPYEGIQPTECTGYMYQDVNFKLREHLNKAMSRFRQGYSLAMIYDDSIDHAGHAWGPDSNEIRVALARIDTILQEMFITMKYHGLYDKVNIIITSDHGMTSIKKDSGVEYIKLSDYVNPDEIYKVIDYGAVVSIAVLEGKVDSVYNQVASIPGLDAYRKNDIPEEFHYKKSKLVHDILLVAKPGYFIVGLKGEKQIPMDAKSSSVQPYAGSHGYYNSSEMRTIFFASGPGKYVHTYV
ncbi:unnamed protein product [Orchesella dallaii]|uniref:Ectonucleotide pyrophosphatase/phosphodiesterase family member 6 n=1 Tax=Orchesella dallaii TaxID=48710 RepID=A0ABP1QQ61_9HEXA